MGLYGDTLRIHKGSGTYRVPGFVGVAISAIDMAIMHIVTLSLQMAAA